MSTLQARTLTDVVDLDRYPLSAPDSAELQEVVARAREGLRTHGCTVLRDFVRPELREALRAEGEALAPQAHYDVETVNAYNIPVDSELPEGHPGRIAFDRGNAFVPRDRIPADSLIARLYAGPEFQDFVARCFALPQLHPLADPLSGLCLNVVRPGMEHPWHFDTNEFTVSMLTREPDDGGTFEYCPGIRSTTAENFDAVRDVLEGRGAELIHRLPLRPGDLQLFQGRYSLHRVSPVRGTGDRHSAIFAYSERPGVVGSVARTRQLFGRVLPEHLAAEGHAVRVDQLLD